MTGKRFVVGDVQGYLDPLERVLAAQGLIDATGGWVGGQASLYVLGDLVDRGPDGVGVIEALMRLQSEARKAGGEVGVVVGNHDVLFMAARKFRAFVEDWQSSGGIATDLERLTAEHVEWLQELPAIICVDGVLMLHADALFYLDYGATSQEVNTRLAEILHGDDQRAWELLLERFGEHRAFTGHDGCANLDRIL